MTVPQREVASPGGEQTERFLAFVAEELDAAIARQHRPHHGTRHLEAVPDDVDRLTRLRDARRRIAALRHEPVPGSWRRWWARVRVTVLGALRRFGLAAPRARIVVPIAAVVVLAAAGVHAGPRTVAALWFLLTCPAQPYVRLLRLGDTVTELVVTVAASLGLATIVAELMLYTGTWSAAAGFVALAVVALVGSAFEVHRTGRRPRQGRRLRRLAGDRVDRRRDRRR